MTDQLSLYNGAVALLKERPIASLSEASPARRALDDAWSRGFVRYCLEQGQWNFAIRTTRVDYSTSITPAFGYTHAFEKPTDWVRTTGLAIDERMTCPLIQYRDEAGLWYADYDSLYASFVSDGAGYGADMSLWPETFARYAEAELASRVAGRIAGSDTMVDRIEKLVQRLKTDARSKDAMNEPVKFPPQGTWMSARRGGRASSRWRER